ncbi:MAG: HepT-like ribonuclease domain-containing protein [Candidatus Gastranaerophilaceae bacterium]
MFKKVYSDAIEDMLQACADIKKAVDGITFGEFEADMFRYRAVERLFEILGEAANRIPKELQEKYCDIAWKNIVGMRNIIIHTYERVDVSTLWGAAKKDLPRLGQSLNKMLLEISKDER